MFCILIQRNSFSGFSFPGIVPLNLICMCFIPLLYNRLQDIFSFVKTDIFKNKMNIVYDTSVLQNTFKMLEHVPKFGYQTKLKIMLVDEYQAAMNVVERKMDNDDAFSRHRQLREKFGYPSGNPLGVKPSTSMNVSAAVEEFVMQAVERGYPLEIYEFGKKEPSFKTGDDFDRFIESLELIPMERHLERCEKLKRRADNAGREEDFMQLMALKKEMMERK